MNREFFINILFLLSINLLIKPFYIFAIDRTVQNVVGPEVYGVYFALFSLTLILQIFHDFGIQNFTSRHIAQHSHLLDKYFPSFLLLKAVLSVFFLLLLMLVGWYLGYTALYFNLLLLLGLMQVTTGFLLFFRANVVGLAHYRLDSILSVLDRVIMIAVCGVLLWTPSLRASFRIEWFVYAHLFSVLVAAIFAYSLVYRHMQRFQLRVNIRLLLVMLKQSYPYALIVLLMVVYNRIDSIMIEQLLADGELEAGIYASAYRLLEAAGMFSYLFANLLLPMFSRMLKEEESVEGLVYFSTKLILAGAITLTIVTFLFQNEIMFLLYDEATDYWGRTLGFLVISYIAISGTYIFGTLLLANGNLRQLNILFIAGMLLNIILNVLVIPQYKALGAAVTTGLTQFFVLGGQMWIARRQLKLRSYTRLLVQLGGFTGAIVVIGYLLVTYVSIDWTVKFGLQILLSAGLAFAFRLLRVKEIMTWFRVV